MKLIVGLVTFILPSKLAILILRSLGYKVSFNSRLGFSFLYAKELELKSNTRLGHFNYISCENLKMEEGSSIGSLNIIKGPIKIFMSGNSAIGNRNLIKRASPPVTYGESSLILGFLSKITASHLIDCTRTVEIGDYSILAGASTQIWTHGYYHYPKGPGRYRIDGEVKIGNNVYVGSRCTFNLGVTISDGISIGSNSGVSKSLEKPGLYVSQPLRYIDTNAEEAKRKLVKIENYTLCEEVFEKIPKEDFSKFSNSAS